MKGCISAWLRISGREMEMCEFLAPVELIYIGLFMCDVYLQPYNDTFYSSSSPNSASYWGLCDKNNITGY